MLDFVAGAKIGNWANVGKVAVQGHLIQNIMMNAIQSISMNQKWKFENVTSQKQAMQRFDAIESEVFCTSPFASQAPPLGFASWLCIVPDRRVGSE